MKTRGNNALCDHLALVKDTVALVEGAIERRNLGDTHNTRIKVLGQPYKRGTAVGTALHVNSLKSLLVSLGSLHEGIARKMRTNVVGRRKCSGQTGINQSLAGRINPRLVLNAFNRKLLFRDLVQRRVDRRAERVRPHQVCVAKRLCVKHVGTVVALVGNGTCHQLPARKSVIGVGNDRTQPSAHRVFVKQNQVVVVFDRHKHVGKSLCHRQNHRCARCRRIVCSDIGFFKLETKHIRNTHSGSTSAAKPHKLRNCLVVG